MHSVSVVRRENRKTSKISYKRKQDRTRERKVRKTMAGREEVSGVFVEHVYKSFGKDAVLKDVNFLIRPGEIFGVVGNNGSGKTVLMKCICGFLKADKGRMGVIIETPGFIPDISGYQNLKILADLKGRIGKQEIQDTIRRVGLDPKNRKPVAKYSLGMRQRLGIAQAIMENPQVLILDEPFNGLDRNGAAQMRELLKELKQQGKSMLLASHNAQDIRELCDRVHDMEDIWKMEELG